MRSAIALLAALSVAAAAPAVQWVRGERSPASEVVPFSVALPARNLDKLDAVFNEVTDPSSPKYGQYKTKAELSALMAADPQLVHEVLGWLGPKTSCKVSSKFLRCRASVATLESLLRAKFYSFEHATNGDVVHRIEGDYGFPEMEGKIEFISGLNQLPVPHLGRVKPAEAVQGTDYYVVPETLRNFYGLNGVTGSPLSIQAPAEFQGYPAYGNDDLNTFIKETGVPSFKVSKTIGPFDQSDPQAESTLDIQYIGAIGVNSTTWYLTEEDWLYEFSELLLNTPETGLPYIFSISYGWYESQQCQISPSAQPCASGGSARFVNVVNTNFKAAGANGITLLVSSGDSGAHGRTDPDCSSPKTRPDYPAVSPYVLAVGATQIQNGVSNGAKSPICQSQLQCATGGSEIVASNAAGALITSGGGFSDIAPALAFQQSVIANYIKLPGVVPPAADYNSSGRGYPDVAALGHMYYIQLTGQAIQVDGTSCSAPVFSGIVSLLNAYRLTAGKPKLGFINPIIYQIAASDPQAFNDITVGDNYCTEDTCDCKTGFKAAVGWDAVSGFGTPNYPRILAALQKLDAEREARFSA